jgi:hypothetical protein
MFEYSNDAFSVNRMKEETDLNGGRPPISREK